MLSLSRTLAVALQAPGALAPCARLLATEAGAGPSSPHGPNSSASTDHSGGEAVGGSHQEPEWDPEHEREQALCREVLRSGLVAEEAAAQLFRGEQCVLGSRRPDLAAFRGREQEHLARLKELAPAYRTRPSLLAPLASAGFFALGAAAAALPPRFSAAVAGGVQEALTDVYNDQLRQLREAGAVEAAPDVRAAVRAARDEDRGVEGAPQAPDLATLVQRERWSDVSLDEGVAAVVKFGTSALINAARRL